VKRTGGSGGWRKNTEMPQLWVHKQIHIAESIPSCEDPTGNNNCCQETYPELWDPSQISEETFDLLKDKRADKAAFIVAAGIGSNGNDLAGVELLVEDDSGIFQSKKIYTTASGCVNIQNLPIASQSATGGIYFNNMQVCTNNGKCYQLSRDGEWSDSIEWTDSNVDVPITSAIFSSSPSGNPTWMFFPESGDISLYPQLPSNSAINLPAPSSDFPCVAMINDNEAFVSFPSKKAWIYNIITNKWTPLPSTEESRIGAACGVINQELVVLAGGSDSSTYETLFLPPWTRTSKGYTSSWKLGPEDLGYKLYGARIVPVDNPRRLLLVGGFSSGQPVTTIKSFSQTTYLWTEVGNLDTARFNAAAFSVSLRSLSATC